MYERKNYGWLFIILFIIIGCSTTNKAMLTAVPFKPGETNNASPDFANLKYWAAHPSKKDPSDSIPLPYRNFIQDSTVDIFFIHPTTYTDGSLLNDSQLSEPSEKVKWNASLDDSALNLKTDNTSILFQASAFNHFRVFAPRYRQAHYQSFYLNDTLSGPFFDTAYTDIKNAFTYYLEHQNQGRPFIIASHSQGTLHAGRLIKDTIEGTELINHMVAAYIIGLPVPETYFSKCVPCSTALQTGCIISWRTFREGYESPRIQKETFKAIVINPLTWTMDTTRALKKMNLGAILYKFNNPIQGAVSATIHGNILWASKPHFFGSIFFKQKNYHIGDINLFWKNIRDNVDERVKAFKEKDFAKKALNKPADSL